MQKNINKYIMITSQLIGEIFIFIIQFVIKLIYKNKLQLKGG